MRKLLLPILLITNIYAYIFGNHSCEGVGTIKYKNALYTGECKKNKKEGRGRIIYNNGNKYEGSFKNDKRDGHGTYHYSNGMLYNGEWKDNKYDGYGSLKYNAKESYEGEWSAGKKDGKGIYRYKDGSVYDGAWKNNTKDGYGVFKYANGVVYKGDFVNNIKEGKGRIRYKSGDTYEGGFKKGKFDGYGVFHLAKGGVYKGEWLAGKRYGKGKFTYASGATYDGEWVNDNKEGNGTYLSAHGDIYKGSWKNNKKNGYGVLRYKSGDRYEGNWQNDKKEGKGLLGYASGKVYDGEWHDDKKEGKGLERTQYGTCSGTWKNGKLISSIERYSQGEAYKHFNEIRVRAGMSELKYNKILQESAQNHSHYIDLHHESMKGLSYHYEKEGREGFTGRKAKDRAVKAGYFSTNIGEGISNYCSAEQSINSLMTAIYHRFEILHFSRDEVGIGFTKTSQNLKHNFVHNMGNSHLNTLCQHDDRWIGNYFEKVCADETLKIKEDPYNEAKDTIRKKNPKYVIWPADGSVDNLYYYADEVPNPMPDFIKTGNPISIQFNPYYFPKNIVVYSFKFYDAEGEVTDTRLLTKQTDPNKKFTQYQYALFALKPLQRDTEYKVVIKYKYEGSSKQLRTSFRTMK